MKPPENVKTIDFSTSIMWFDENGILYSTPKPNAQYARTREESEKQMDEFRKLVGNKKVCMILESDKNSPPPKREDRDWIARELDSVTKAMAIISASPASRMIANLFFGLKPPSYPVKFFSNEIDAREWVRQYL